MIKVKTIKEPQKYKLYLQIKKEKVNIKVFTFLME